jgi:hypothetical protein
MQFGIFQSEKPQRPRRGLRFDANRGEYFNLEHINYRIFEDESPAQPEADGPYLTLVMPDWDEGEQ